jgi:hypothetical protein
MNTWVEPDPYPFVDFVEIDPGAIPLDAEKNQMNVFLASARKGSMLPALFNTLLAD